MKNCINYVLNKYLDFITKIYFDHDDNKFTIPKWWLITRFIIHWITLPIKLTLIGLMMLFDIIYQYIFYNIKLFYIDLDINKFKKLFNELPVLNGLYVNRVPLSEKPNGKNHNTDHQTARQGVFVFLMRRLKRDYTKALYALTHHLNNKMGCIRGFSDDGANTSNVSGEQFLNICFGTHEIPLRASLTEEGGINYVFCERMEEAIFALLKNDYAIGTLDNKKSLRGMFQPGLEVVGAHALVILAILKYGIVKMKLREVKPFYNSLLYKYGYGLLALFPTAWLPFRRNLSNDVNSMTAAYLLYKLSDSKLSKLYWTLIMFNIWLLSFKTYNGYITGMLNEAAPWLLSKSYINKCKAHLAESNLDGVGYYKFKTNGLFINYSEWFDGEFLPEENVNEFADFEREAYHSGLGPLATLVMIDPETTSQLVEKLNEK